MDQKTIVDGLLKALANGSGTLDNLDELLDRAKDDIAAAKQEEIEAQKKAAAEKEAQAQARGKLVADLATRVLHDETTDEDCAYVINSWARKNGLKGDGFTGKELREVAEEIKNTRKQTSKVMSEFEEIIEAFCQTLESFGDKHDMPRYEDKKPEKKKDNPEDVIDNFLKSFGLR